jgi:hypothetical protein
MCQTTKFVHCAAHGYVSAERHREPQRLTKQPVSELDTRFSEQDAVATDWEETRRVLDEAELFWISTV